MALVLFAAAVSSGSPSFSGKHFGEAEAMPPPTAEESPRNTPRGITGYFNMFREGYDEVFFLLHVFFLFDTLSLHTTISCTFFDALA